MLVVNTWMVYSFFSRRGDLVKFRFSNLQQIKEKAEKLTLSKPLKNRALKQ